MDRLLLYATVFNHSSGINMSLSNRLSQVGAACALLFAAVSAQAGPVMWVSTGGGQLAKVDVATGGTTLVGSTLVGSTLQALTDIAFSPTGVLYGITFSNLYTVNQSTGALTLIGSLGTSGNSLVFGADGTLYMASSRLHTVNTSTGTATAIGSGIGFSSAGDLAFVGSKLFMAGSGNQLVDIDLTTGSGTSVGNMGVSSMFGLATPDNITLYGVADQSVYTINTLSGAASFQSTFNPTLSGGAFGLAFFTEANAQVPEPSTFALAGLALFGVFAARRRAQRG
jgi:PEP-CTERM motif